MSTDTDISTVEEVLDEALRSTHMVTPSDNPQLWIEVSRAWAMPLADVSGQVLVDYARRNNLEVTAVCGYTWVPFRNPERYDMCGLCYDEATKRMQENNE